MIRNIDVEYSERQKGLLREIGSRNRSRIKKDMILNTYTFLGSYFFIIIVSLVIALHNPIYYLLLTVLIVFGFIGLVVPAIMYREKCKSLMTASDIEVGIFYRRKDLKVIGNAKLKRQNTLIPFMFIFIMSVCFIMIMIIAVTSDKPDYNQLVYETKEIETISNNRGYIKFGFVGDSNEYYINSIYNDFIDRSLILNSIEISDSVIIGYIYDEGNHNISILYLKHESMILMGETEFNQGYDQNNRLAFVILIGVSLIACLVFAMIIYYSIIGYNRNIKMETINLELTKDEIRQMQGQEIDQTSEIVNIHSKTRKTKRHVVTILAILFLVIDISLILTISSDDKIYAGISMSIPALAFIIWAISCYTSRDIIEGNLFIKKRLVFTKEIKINDIKMVKYTLSRNIYGLIFYDDFDNEIANFIPLEKSSDQLLEGFRKLGIIVQKYE